MNFSLIILFACNVLAQQFLFDGKTKQALVDLFRIFRYFDWANFAYIECDARYGKKVDCLYQTRSAVTAVRLDTEDGKRLRAPLPTTIGYLSALTELDLANLWGVTLPTEMKNLKSLKKLRLRNAHLTRPIPKEISNAEGMDCEIEILPSSLRRTCTGCYPRHNCRFNETLGNPCDDLCYLLQENETLYQATYTKRDALGDVYDTAWNSIVSARRILAESGQDLPAVQVDDMGLPVIQSTTKPPVKTVQFESRVRTLVESTEANRASSDTEPEANFFVVYVIVAATGSLICLLLTVAIVYRIMSHEKVEEPDLDPLAYFDPSAYTDPNQRNSQYGPAPVKQPKLYGESSLSAL